MTDERMPWYQWLVLAGALAMSAPGEYDLAVAAGWVPAVAWVMPMVVSVYGAVAAYVARKVPKGTMARRSAVAGALAALLLALAFQVTAHLMAAGYVHESAWLVAAVSATPPVVVAHLMHMPRPLAKVADSSAAATVEEAETVTASESGGRPAGMAAGTEAVADGPGPTADAVAVNGSPAAATAATDESAAVPESVVVAAAAAGGRLRPWSRTGRGRRCCRAWPLWPRPKSGRRTAVAGCGGVAGWCRTRTASERPWPRWKPRGVR